MLVYTYIQLLLNTYLFVYCIYCFREINIEMFFNFDVHSFVPPHGVAMNHHGGIMGITDEGFLHQPPGNKESPLLHHKELGLDDQEHRPTVVNPPPATRSISNNSTPLQKTAILQSTAGSSETPEKKQGMYVSATAAHTCVKF